MALTVLTAAAGGDVRAADTAWYARAGVGTSRLDGECGSLPNASSAQCDTRATAFVLAGGFQLSRNIALELGYLRLGTLQSRETNAVSVQQVRSRIDGLGLSVVGTAPVTEAVSLHARVGWMRWRATTRVDLTLLPAGTFLPGLSDDQKGTRPTVGAGASFALTPRLSLQADWDHTRAEVFVRGRNVDLYSTGLRFNF